MKEKGGRRRSNNKHPLKSTKLKTEAHEPINKSKCKSKNKKHLPTSVDEDDEHGNMFETFYKIQRKRGNQ